MQNETVNTEWGNAEAEAMCCGLLWTLDLRHDALIVGTTPDPDHICCTQLRGGIPIQSVPILLKIVEKIIKKDK